MNRNAIITVLAVTVLAVLTGSAQAKLIKIGLTAEIETVSDNGGLLNGEIMPGDIITGYYVYDTETENSSVWWPEVGEYYQTEPECGVYLSVADFEFRSRSGSDDYSITITNNWTPDGSDQYVFISNDNLPTLGGIGIETIGWQLDDPTGNAISSHELTAVPPNLEDWVSISGLSIISDKIGDSLDRFSIGANVTSVWLIPEPTTIILLGSGFLLLRKRWS